MGLSLTSDAVGWALVDTAEGAVLDHDALEFPADADTAGVAARGAQAIATIAGLDVDYVRLTWSDKAAQDGLRLRSRLRSQGFTRVEAVPLSCALAAAVGPEHADMANGVVLAYQAAIATVGNAEAITEPVIQRPPRRARPRRLLSSALGIAAAVTLGVLCLGAGAGPNVVPTVATIDQPAPTEPGWIAVPAAPSNPTGSQARKVAAAAPSTDVTPGQQTSARGAVQAIAGPPVVAAPQEPVRPTAVAEPSGSVVVAGPAPSVAVMVAEPTQPAPIAAPVEQTPATPESAQPVAEPAPLAPVTEPVQSAPATEPAQSVAIAQPVQQVPITEPAPVSQTVGQPHLPAAQPAAAPHVVDPVAPPAPGPQAAQPVAPAPSGTEVGDLSALFTALP